MPKSQLSTKAQIGVVLGVLMFFSVAITIAGFAASAQTSDKMAAFASDGAVVTGTITKKYIHGVAKNWVYWLDVRFTSQDGVTHDESTNVANTIFDGLDEGVLSRLRTSNPILNGSTSRATHPRSATWAFPTSCPKWASLAGFSAPSGFSASFCGIAVAARLPLQPPFRK
jgi:hypothetical protein